MQLLTAVLTSSEPIVNGQGVLPLTVNTAAWANISSAGVPSLTQYGPSQTQFYALQWFEKFIFKASVSFLTHTIHPHQSGQRGSGQYPNIARTSFLISLPEFWSDAEASYGAYGGLVQDNVAYLYAQRTDGSVTLAKVPSASVTDKTQYQYYLSGAWTTTVPGRNDTSATIPNAGAGGQGTFYYSRSVANLDSVPSDCAERERAAFGTSMFGLEAPRFQWTILGATFYMTTAPAAEGPWAAPYEILSERGGTAALPAYSLQAHPGLTTGTGSDMYLTFTNQSAVYTTPLIHVIWA
ncbi:hypothetical protein HWV62_9321 [Athelia sp. TMB]|nr:hypothetical protein HWV62_9321 [Athelia sp. TMB]